MSLTSGPTEFLHINRAQHDRMLDENAELLRQIFRQSGHRAWSLSGVTLYRVPCDLAQQAKSMMAAWDGFGGAK